MATEGQPIPAKKDSMHIKVLEDLVAKWGQELEIKPQIVATMSVEEMEGLMRGVVKELTGTKGDEINKSGLTLKETSLTAQDDSLTLNASFEGKFIKSMGYKLSIEEGRLKGKFGRNWIEQKALGAFLPIAESIINKKLQSEGKTPTNLQVLKALWEEYPGTEIENLVNVEMGKHGITVDFQPTEVGRSGMKVEIKRRGGEKGKEKGRIEGGENMMQYFKEDGDRVPFGVVHIDAFIAAGLERNPGAQDHAIKHWETLTRKEFGEGVWEPFLKKLSEVTPGLDTEKDFEGAKKRVTDALKEIGADPEIAVKHGELVVMVLIVEKQAPNNKIVKLLRMAVLPNVS